MRRYCTLAFALMLFCAWNKRFASSRGLLAALLLTMLLPAARGETVADQPAGLGVVDLRPTFRQSGLPLRMQGKRGTCSVFAMTGALEYALAHKAEKGTLLSVEFLNWASNQATTNSHDGGFFSDLWTGFTAYGICPESSFPYRKDYDAKLRPDESAMQHAKGTARARLQLHWIKPWDVRTGLTEAQFGEIKRTLTQGWPVCGGFRWPKHERWQNEVLQMAPPREVFDGHSVLLVGFRDNAAEPGGGVFLIRNSGGGVHDGAMTYEYVRAYMNDAVWINPASAAGYSSAAAR